MYVCMSGKACVHDMLVYWESKLIFLLSPGRGESVERLLAVLFTAAIKLRCPLC